MHPATAQRYINGYVEGLRDQITVLSEDEVSPIEDLCAQWSPDRRVQVLSAAEYMANGPKNLAYWANQAGVFSIPTLELSDWLDELMGHDSPKTRLHEIGCGNAALAKFRGHSCSDSRMNCLAQQMAKQLGTSSAKVPSWVATREGTAAAKVFKPDIVLAQWVTPGGLADDCKLMDGRNSYGPDYPEILRHCKKLVFIGNDNTHGEVLSNILPPPDEELRPDWLLSRSLRGGEFIKIWEGQK